VELGCSGLFPASGVVMQAAWCAWFG